MSSSIKAAIFDYGGVVSRGGGDMVGFLRTIGLGSLSGTDAESKYLWPTFGRLVRGQIDEVQFFEIIEESTGVPPVDDVIKVWSDYILQDMAPEQAVLDAIAKTKSSGLYVSLLSVITPLGAQLLESAGHYDLFDDLVLSCREGIKKPKLEAFQTALDLSGFEAEQCLMLDDSQKNIEAARLLGMKGYEVSNYEKFLVDLDSLLELR